MYKCRYYDMKNEPFLTTDDAALILDLDPRQVQRMAKAGLIPGARRVGKSKRAPYILPTEAVEKLASQRKKAKEKRARGQKPRAR